MSIETRRLRRWGKLLPVAAASAVVLAMSAPGRAMELETGNPDLSIRWDNTVKYSTGIRLKDPSPGLVADRNQDDGDRNFKKHGLISNRVDWLTEFDVKYQSVGARVSAAAWYDQVYNGSTDNNSPGTSNAFSVPSSEFPAATRRLHGRKGEILDAFVFGETTVAGRKLTGRLGRHALLYGESLFFGNNGIAAAQAPIDVIKALSVPNSQFKELLLPVEQVSGQVQFSPSLSVGAYYQFAWRKTRLPGVGSYFSTSDVLDEGGERFLAGPTSAGPAFFRGSDQKARDSGQGGLQLRYTPANLGVDFGLYAVRYHDKLPQVYIRPGANAAPGIGKIGEYLLTYPENIKAYGASFSTTVGSANIAGEASVRRNAPLASIAVLDAGAGFDNNGNPGYAVGRTAHAQVSAFYTLPPNFISRESLLLTEVAWNRVLSVTRNRAALDPGANRDAWAFRVIFEPTYRQVIDGLDISIPVGLGYSPDGKSGAVTGFAKHKGGDFSLQVKGNYLDKVRFGVGYTHYFGSEGPTIGPTGTFTFRQSSRDRDFITFNVSSTF